VIAASRQPEETTAEPITATSIPIAGTSSAIAAASCCIAINFSVVQHLARLMLLHTARPARAGCGSVLLYFISIISAGMPGRLRLEAAGGRDERTITEEN
jgi:hypothetical protein